MISRDDRAFGAIAALLFAAGCSLRSSQATFSPQIRGGAAVRSLSTSGQYLYAAGLKLSNYRPDGLKPLHTVDNGKYGFGEAPSLGVDAQGNYLYEDSGNPSDALMAVYDARTLKQLNLFSTSICESIAVDRLGYVYAGCGTIYVYTPGATRQVGRLDRGGYRLAFDHRGNLYATAGHRVRVYAPTQTSGKMKFERNITDGVHGASALAIGPSNDLFVANWDDANPLGRRSSVTVYPAGASRLSRKIINGIVAPAALAVDSKGRLYVINLHIRKPPFFGWVTVYAPGGTEPVRKITDGTTEPTALAVDAADDLYVAIAGNPGSVRVYGPGGTKLLRTLVKGIDSPQTLLIGAP
jgi:hypothetical protein